MDLPKAPWKSSKLRGSQWIRRSLELLQVDFVFGLPGTQNSPIFNALAHSPIRTIVPTHELAASFMAIGYARISGRPGVLLTIPGPGFTYALSGVAEAQLDSVPILWISIAPRNQKGRRFQLQAIEQSAIAHPLVKKIFHVEHTGNIARILKEAHASALAGEPGPVLVQLSEEALAGEERWEDSPAQEPSSPPELNAQRDDAGQAGADGGGITTVGDSPGIPGTKNASEIAEAARRIAQSRRILVIAGQGAQGAAKPLREFVEKRRALVLTTTSGRGIVPEDHPLSLGFECSGTRAKILDDLVQASDTVLALGCKFSHNSSRGFRWKIPPEKLIHVDASEKVLQANYPAQLPIVSEVGEFLHALRTTSQRSEETVSEEGASGWSPQEAEDWKKRGPRESWIEAAEPLLLGEKPARFFEALREVLPRNSILVTDSGLHQLLCRRYYRVDEVAGLITPTDFQSMGFSLPAAIGASLADPLRKVVALVGDGGLLMSGLEILTAVKIEISLLILVINDGSYGLIRREQLAATGSAPGSTLINPSFEDFARAVHANYLALGNDFTEQLREALALDGVTLVEVKATDSPAMLLQRNKGTLKRAAGSRLLNWVKKLLRS